MFPIDAIIKRRWPVNVLIRYPRKGGEEWWFDRARREKDKITRKEYYKIRKLKAKAKPALFKNMVESNNGLFAEFYSPSPHEYYPCKIKAGWVADGALYPCELTPEEVITLSTGERIEKRGEVIPMNEDQKMFWADVVHHQEERWRRIGFWEKYGGIIMPIMVIALMAFAFVFMSYAYANYIVPANMKIGGALERLYEKLGPVIEAMDRFAQVNAQVNARVPPPA